MNGNNSINYVKKQRGRTVFCPLVFFIVIVALFSACDNNTEPELEKNLYLLKAGELKPLVGFSIGDTIDYGLVDTTDDYFNGGRISKLKTGEYSNVFLFFNEADNKLEGLGAENTVSFFGIRLGEDEPKKVYDILGEPDVYEEESDMTNLPSAIYYFEKNAMYIDMNSDNKIISITYKSQINGGFPSEPQENLESVQDNDTDGWITSTEAVDLEGMNLYWQHDNIQFRADENAKLSLYVKAEKDDSGQLLFDDGQDWLLLLETAIGNYPLFERKYVQIGGVACDVFIGADDTFHILVIVRQTAGYLMYDCVFYSDKQAFKIVPIYEAKGINFITTSK